MLRKNKRNLCRLEFKGGRSSDERGSGNQGWGREGGKGKGPRIEERERMVKDIRRRLRQGKKVEEMEKWIEEVGRRIENGERKVQEGK